MKQYSIRYWAGTARRFGAHGSGIQIAIYRAKSPRHAAQKFHKRILGGILGIEEISE